ncbi:MAG: hypothetical protein RIS92_3017, partial [Verrucomicrobiota bacterium]
QAQFDDAGFGSREGGAHARVGCNSHAMGRWMAEKPQRLITVEDASEPSEQGAFAGGAATRAGGVCNDAVGHAGEG